ncbi:MAG: TIM barrel protein [Candidatus Lokiarchaeia archaeon]
MIKNIRFGIKIATSNFDFLPDIYKNKNLIDFVEVIVLPDFKLGDINIIKRIKMPYAIHLPNSNYGIDLGDIKRNRKNIEFINNINQYRGVFKTLNPICYIIHPESGNIKLSIDNLKKFKIKPLAIENMPIKGIHGEALLGYSPRTLTEYFEKIKDLEFCFDINHAIKTAISLKVDYIDFIKKFLTYKKPRIFHISGGNLDIEIDEHLSLEKGQYNIVEIKKFLLQYDSNVNLTFETPRNYKTKIKDDLKNMKFFLKA